MPASAQDSVRGSFKAATGCFLELAAAVPDASWDAPGIGVWTIRDLVGHASRALGTLEAYLDKAGEGAPLEGPAAYFLAVGADPPGSEGRAARDLAIAGRGREAGIALGARPGVAVGELARRVLALVDASPDRARVATPAGPMTLITYLPTRTFELTIHSLDLARATHQAPPATLAPAIAASVVLAGQVAAVHPLAARVLEALCGRSALPEGFTVV
ncbi:MAG: maleylpyruvate isomerase N-terminal domain-containing protein [Candidatus Dormiibacterota bacterium]